ncbi:MAG: hypothetical protein IJ105_00960 [Bacilli bacterium]|nr:hypothetical protein [Bacilli bacterium]
MNKKNILELLFAKDWKKTLKYIKKYETYMRNGISYEQLRNIMQYDYKVFLEKEFKKDIIDLTKESAIYQIIELDNIYTNIKSRDDATCKFKSLTLAKENIDEEIKNTILD